MQTDEQNMTVGRIALGLVGAAAGLSAWVLLDVLPDRLVDYPRMVLFLTALAGAFFVAVLAMVGPVSLRRAALAAAIYAGPVAILMTWASLRFDTVEDSLKSGHPLFAYTVLVLIPLPFMISRLQRGKWGQYDVLFDQSWNIVVRYVAAWLFVGAVWALLMLSDALFQLVGLTIIEDLLDIEAVPYLLTGTVLGVALAVVNELSDYVSPYLVLRLLRLLMPAVLVVVAVFLIALPFRGLSHLFGSLSVATTLLAMAGAAATLVTTALDTDDSRAVKGSLMGLTCQALALCLPALAGLAGYAVLLRVMQYGWTPDRLAAATIATIALGYGTAYAAAILWRQDWQGRIRGSNVVMAVLVLCVAALWLTPLFSPQRLSTADQIARFENGRVKASAVDLWVIGHEWGRAGTRGLERLAALKDHPEATQMALLLEEFETAGNRMAFDNRRRVDDFAQRVDALGQVMPIRPEGATLPAALTVAFQEWDIRRFEDACARRTKGGNPGCVAVLADLAPNRPGDELMIVTLSAQGRPMANAYYAEHDPAVMVSPRYPQFEGSDTLSVADDALIDALIAGEYALRPVQARSVQVGGVEIYFGR